MITLFFDGILPFVIISIMNILIIRAIRQRHRKFDIFNAENPTGLSGNNESGNIKRINWKLHLHLHTHFKIWTNLHTCFL